MPKAYNRSSVTTVDKAEMHDNLMPLLCEMFGEFQELSKKKPDGVLNKFKVGAVNRLLRDVHRILEEEPTTIYLDILDEDDLPQNSDVVLILGQTVTAMRTFKNKYDKGDDFHHEWAMRKNN